MSKIINLPLSFKKALITNIPLKKDEIILQTIYNNKCVSLKTLWNILPKAVFYNDINSKNQLKTKYLLKMQEDGAIYRDKVPEIERFRKGGYAVDVNRAYEKKLPYTLANLDPLPPLEREDYIYFMLMRDPNYPYQIFPESKFEMIDKIKSDFMYLVEKFGDDISKVSEDFSQQLSVERDVTNKILENKNKLNKI
jgi:hypothetical protein